MDEREMFEAWVDAREGSSLRSGFDGTLDYPLGNIMWEVWQAARRTTPDREAGLEDAALLMEQRAAEIEACGGLTAGTMARIYRDEASKIRALKTAPTTSPRDTLIEEIAEMVDHMGEGRRLEEYVGAIREMKGGKS